MRPLAFELLLRLAKVGAAAIVGLLIYVVLTGPLGNHGSVELALLAFVSGGAVILLVESSPI